MRLLDGDADGLVDSDAFTALVDRDGADIHSYLARRAPGAAEDLLGRVWLEAFASRAGFDPARGSARSWLFGVARHVLVRHWRSQRSAPLSAAWPVGVLDPWDEVDRRIDSAALGGSLRSALAQLPEVDREMLLLIAWEQLTPAEAAAVVGVPAATARTRLHRARARMRDALAADDPPREDPHPDVTDSLPLFARRAPGGLR